MNALPFLIGGVAAMGSLMKGIGEAQQLSAQADAAKYNAAVLRQQSDQALRTSAAEEATQRRQAEQVLGTQRAAIAESGLGFGGSAADVMRESRIEAELDALNIRYKGQLESRNLLSAAALEKYKAATARRQVPLAYVGAGTSALSEGVSGYVGGGRLSKFLRTS